MPYKNGKFIPAGKVMHKPGATKPTISGRPHGTAPEHEKEHGAPQAPHGSTSQEQHVKETHPGTTQPHPETGVHAFHAHHTGSHASGGPAYSTHTHHDDGTVETKENRSQDEMEQDQQAAFPPGAEQAENEMPGTEADFGDALGGISGEAA